MIRLPALVFLFIFICAITVGKYAEAAPPVTSLGSSPTFKTLEEAASRGVEIAFSSHIKQKAEKGKAGEFAGVVFQCPEGFFYSDPVTTNSTHHVQFSASIPKDCTIQGIFHIHPALSGTPEMFSEADVAMVKRFNIPSYLGIAADLTLRVLTPKATEPQTYQDRKTGEIHASSGQVLAKLDESFLLIGPRNYNLARSGSVTDSDRR